MSLSKLQIVLVEPIYPGNVGAVARSAKNFGINSIKIVGDLDILCLDAKKMALYGYDLLQQATHHSSLLDAVKDCSLVIGTVHQTRYHRSGPRPIWDIFPDLASQLMYQNTAIVFGREDNGLNREEVDLCHILAVIPTPEKLSFNLAHSVSIFLYEIHRCLYKKDIPETKRRPNQLEYEEFMTLLEQLLHEIEFIKGTQKDSVLTMMRDILYRSQIGSSDLPVIKAVMYKMLEKNRK